MNTNLLSTWNTSSSKKNSTVILPDGCRDLIMKINEDEKPFWFISPLFDKTEVFSINPNSVFSGYRMKPGVTFSEKELIESIQGNNYDLNEISNRLNDFTSLNHSVEEALNCLASNIDSVKVYADKGIEIFADEYSIAAIKAYPGFTDDIAKFKFRTIKDEHVIDGAHFYVLENMHAKKQSFVHFKDNGIIFQSKFLHIAFDNTIAKVIPSYSRTFIDFVRRKQLKFTRIVGNYQNNNISVEVMNKTYDAIM